MEIRTTTECHTGVLVREAYLLWLSPEKQSSNITVMHVQRQLELVYRATIGRRPWFFNKLKARTHFRIHIIILFLHSTTKVIETSGHVIGQVPPILKKFKNYTMIIPLPEKLIGDSYAANQTRFW